MTLSLGTKANRLVLDLHPMQSTSTITTKDHLAAVDRILTFEVSEYSK